MLSTAINKVAILGASGLVAQETIKAFNHAGMQLKLFSRNIIAENHPENETVKGDVFNEEDLAAAIDGCDAIHITLAQLDELSAVQKIIAAAKKNTNIKLISLTSGATVCKRNSRLLDKIDAKYQSEKLLKTSGIPFLIFRPTWFMESLLHDTRRKGQRDGQAA